MNTKFDKTNVSTKLLCVTPLNKQVFQKKIVAPKTEVKHVLPKTVTLQTLPNKQQVVEAYKNVIAMGIYKIEKKQNINTNKAKRFLSSTRLRAASSIRGPSNRDSSFQNSVLANTKKSSEKVEASVSTNKKTYVASKNVVSYKKIATNVDVKNALKVKDVLRALFTTLSTTKSKFEDTTPVVSKTGFSIKTTQSKSLDTTPVVVQIVLWIVDSGCSKHMMGDRTLLKIFVEKFIGTVRFGNDHFTAVIGYGDYVQRNITVFRVYYVEGLGHNLFSVGQFCDGDLEVAFRSKTCYVRNLEGDDLLTGARESNLYTIFIFDMVASSPICFMFKATLTKSWFWHRRLSHLNFGTINDLTKHDLVDGLLKFKYDKDHLCSACNSDGNTQEENFNWKGWCYSNTSTRTYEKFMELIISKENSGTIRTRFGGNANSKKMQKAVFKQQFEAFKISSSDCAYRLGTPSTSSTNIPEKEVLAGFADEVIYSLFAKQSED
ncbi:integrase, catalytic region, zinc finger, CCHC-type containing protein [Tanacetum coccineum]